MTSDTGSAAESHEIKIDDFRLWRAGELEEIVPCDCDNDRQTLSDSVAV